MPLRHPPCRLLQEVQRVGVPTAAGFDRERNQARRRDLLRKPNQEGKAAAALEVVTIPGGEDSGQSLGDAWDFCIFSWVFYPIFPLETSFCSLNYPSFRLETPF